MNFIIDFAIRSIIRIPLSFNEAMKDHLEVEKRLGVRPSELKLIVEGDLCGLATLGMHPLLLVQLAGCLAIDPIERLASSDHRPGV